MLSSDRCLNLKVAHLILGTGYSFTVHLFTRRNASISFRPSQTIDLPCQRPRGQTHKTVLDPRHMPCGCTQGLAGNSDDVSVQFNKLSGSCRTTYRKILTDHALFCRRSGRGLNLATSPESGVWVWLGSPASRYSYHSSPALGECYSFCSHEVSTFIAPTSRPPFLASTAVMCQH